MNPRFHFSIFSKLYPSLYCLSPLRTPVSQFHQRLSTISYNYLFFFFRRYGKPCTICNEGISPKQSVRKVLDKVYHISCFSCVSCKQQLSTGDLFYLLEDGGIICKPDYDGEQLTKYSGNSLQ